MYAWSKFKKETNEWGQVKSWIMPGDEVSQSDLDVSDEEWEGLIASGAVREDEYPSTDPGQSPAEYYKAHPDEAPTVNVDETTPSAEAMPVLENADESGSKLPTGDTESTDASKSKPWEK